MSSAWPNYVKCQHRPESQGLVIIGTTHRQRAKG